MHDAELGLLVEVVPGLPDSAPPVSCWWMSRPVQWACVNAALDAMREGVPLVDWAADLMGWMFAEADRRLDMAEPRQAQ